MSITVAARLPGAFDGGQIGAAADAQDPARGEHHLARGHAARPARRQGAGRRQRARALGIHIIHGTVGEAEDPPVRRHPVTRIPPVNIGGVDAAQQAVIAVLAANLGPIRADPGAGRAFAALNVDIAVGQRGRGGVPARLVHVGAADKRIPRGGAEHGRLPVAVIGGRRPVPDVATEQGHVTALRQDDLGAAEQVGPGLVGQRPMRRRLVPRQESLARAPDIVDELAGLAAVAIAAVGQDPAVWNEDRMQRDQRPVGQFRPGADAVAGNGWPRHGQRRNRGERSQAPWCAAPPCGATEGHARPYNTTQQEETPHATLFRLSVGATEQGQHEAIAGRSTPLITHEVTLPAVLVSLARLAAWRWPTSQSIGCNTRHPACCERRCDRSMKPRNTGAIRELPSAAPTGARTGT